MSRAERAKANAQALQMFIAGATYQQIAERVGMTEAAVEKAIRQALTGASARRRQLMADEAAAVFIERTEALFRAHYKGALAGDHRSAQICLGILTAPAPPENTGAAPIGDSLTGGNEIKALEALRDRLGREIDACKSPRILATLSRQLTAVIAQLAEMKPPATGSKRDELARKRAERLRRIGAATDDGGPGAEDSGRAAGADQRR